jgi:bifunctional enzyme CysN/CysC
MMELLRFATAGSVDDGKSTLIGRLLYDSKSIFEDQLQAVEKTSMDRGDEYVNLALLTDGLRAEREQGITIDVAYRYFATPKRSFIIADTPGHTQHTRNMVTGASTADLILVLVDARNGIIEQTRRHALIASILRIPHLVLCINKMDLVDYSQDVFNSIKDEFLEYATRLDIKDITTIPVSALTGDNVVSRSSNMDWYDGYPLLRFLEEVYIGSDRNLVDLRFPVQMVIRPISDGEIRDYRGYGGQLVSGILEKGTEVLALPSGFKSKIAKIEGPEGELLQAVPYQSVIVCLEDEIDISRGDMLCRPNNRPTVGQDVSSMICWMSENPLVMGKKYIIKHTTKTLKAMATKLHYRLNVNTSHRDMDVQSLELNEIGRVDFRLSNPIYFDDYKKNRDTGSFIVIDEATNSTVAAGLITGEAL